MAEPIQRGGVRDRNAERAAVTERNQQLQQVDSFAPQQSVIFGDTSVKGSPLLNGLAKFATDRGAIEFEKQQKAAFLEGQQLQAAGAEMADGLAPPTRRGYKAMQAKLAVDSWYEVSKNKIPGEDNDVTFDEYAKQTGASIKGLLTGDRELDAMITEAAVPLVSELGRFQANANVKRRRADAIDQSTVDITNSVRAMQDAKQSGDIKGEAAARERLGASLSLPVIADPELRQQTYADLAALTLDMGDPTMLNYVRAQGIGFNVDQEKSLLSAKARYTAAENTKLDTLYQNDLGDFETTAISSGTLEGFRAESAKFQGQYPTKKSNAYYATLERKWKAAKGAQAVEKSYNQDYREGKLASVPGLSNSDVQATMRSVEAEIDSNPNLSDSDKQEQKLKIFVDNNLVQDDKKTRWNAGMTSAVNDKGLLDPAFETAYNEFTEFNAANPDLAMQHLSTNNRLKFKSIQPLVQYGGMELRDAAVQVETSKQNYKDLTPDEKTELKNEVDDAMDTVIGKGFFNFRSWTDAVGATTAIRNESMVRERMTRLAKSFMDTGYTDPAGAAETARIKIMETHEQVGDSLVYNGGKPLAEQMQVAQSDVAEAIEYQKQGIMEANPDFDEGNLVLLGDPRGNALMFGNMNENGVIVEMVSTDLAAAGAAFHKDVVEPRDALQKLDMSAAATLRQREQRRLEEAVNSDIYTESEFNAANSNWLGKFVMEQRVKPTLDTDIGMLKDTLRTAIIEEEGLEAKLSAGGIQRTQAEQVIAKRIEEGVNLARDKDSLVRRGIQQKEMDDNGIETIEEHETWRQARAATKDRKTEAQRNMIREGKLDEYELSKYPELPEQPDTTSRETFVGDALNINRKILAYTGIFPEVATAISVQETGFGGINPDSSVKGNNYFGIKGEGQTFMTNEEVDGVDIPQLDNFKVFGSYAEATQGLREFLYTNPRYKDALAAATPEEQVRLLQKAGYATDSTWGASLINIMSQPRFEQ